MPNQEKKLFVIVGPTAIGKTNLAIQLAQQLNTEILSADSRQCFKELTIGVAKPSQEELTKVKHHFINSHSIVEDVSAGVYEKYGLDCLTEIFRTNQTAIVVGGTGLYIKALCEGFDAIPNIDKSIRDAITQNYQQLGIAWLQQEVEKKDNSFWNKSSEKQNPQRLMRALEVMEGTGKSILSYSNTNTQQRPFTIYKIGLELPREQLYQNINKRVDVMVSEGLLKEVESLLPYKYLNALQTVGYKELFSYLNNEISLAQAIDLIKQNTRHYAKRQLTWFKKDESITWFSASEPSTILNWVQGKIVQ